MKTKILLLLVLVGFLVSPFKGKAQAANVQDSLALVDLYDSAAGKNWYGGYNWLKTPVGQWDGITVNNGRVVEINLAYHNLNGSLPASLGHLDSLQQLYLNVNNLTGSIPPQLGNLKNLNYLTLSANKLSGSIPASLSALNKLTYLDLSNNGLTGAIPATLNQLTNLTYLDVSYNLIGTSIPVFLSSLTNLQYLYLSNDHLIGSVPAFLGNLTNLRGLHVNNNQLAGSIPGSLNNILYLSDLEVQYNNLSDSIPSFKNLSLYSFWADDNKFTFDNLQHLPFAISLRYSPQDTMLPIHINSNKFSISAGGILSNNTYYWYNGATLVKTITGDSTFKFTSSGSYHVSITNSVASQLNLTSDTLTVSTPEYVIDSLALVDLYKNTNGNNWFNRSGWLYGPLNTWYGVTTDSNNVVIGINLSGNRLTGIIPGSIDSLTKLKTLNLSYNYLTFNGLEKLSQKFNFVVYSPQQQVALLQPGVEDVAVSAGGTIANNTYNWYNGSTLVKTVTGDSVYKYTGVGKYSVAVTNSDVPKLTLYSDTFYVTIPLNVQDSLALVDLYNSTGGNNWLTKTNWLSGKLSTWYGVSLDSSGRVTEINLASNGLVGPIPYSIGTLINLKALNLSHNKLYGSIPFPLTNFIGLQNLSLSDNFFTFNTIEPLVQADSLTIYAPQDTVLPIHYNNYTLSVSAGGTLTKNTYNWYKDSVLVGSTLGDSTYAAPVSGTYSVTVSNALANKLILHSDAINITVPTLVTDSLTLIQLFDSVIGTWYPKTAFVGPVKTWPSITLDSTGRVSKIYVDGGGSAQTDLIGTIPSLISNLSHLQTLVFRGGNIKGNIPASLGTLSNLTWLDLTSNKLSGKIPASLGNLSNLIVLELANNQLTDSIPSSLSNLVKLSTLDFSTNQLTGGIPTWISKLINLGGLNLGANNLTGPIPDAVGKLTKLQALSLFRNQLTGVIPSSLGNLVLLYSLDLSYNQLSGSIPYSLSNYDKNALEVFDLRSNKLSGEVPSFLANYYTNLNIISIDNNHFTFKDFDSLVNTTWGIFIVYYTNQDTVLPIFYTGNKLTISGGGNYGYNTYTWFKNGVSIATNINDSTFAPTGPGVYSVALKNSALWSLTLYSDTITINSDSLILPARPNTEYASYEYTDTAGWTHYYYNNNTPNDLTDDTLLLSLKKNGQDIGSIGDGTFAVKLTATAGAGSNTGVHLTNPLITNTSSYWVMNRYWQVTPTHEPAASVGVRFYYNNQDLKDVNGSYPTHNLTNNKLIFYKAVGGNPDPTTNLAGATRIISILPGTVASDTSWTYHALSDTTQYGEYSVASFSGGGGGGTGNNEALPAVLINFTASLLKNDAQLNWQTSQEVNAGDYTVERSLTGTGFTAIGTVEAAGNSTITQSYKLTDYNAALLNTTTLYYRLKITDKDGNFIYSKVIKIDIADGNAFVVYPNPAQNTATLSFTATAAGKYAIQITDIAGKTVKRIESTSAMGSNTVTINVSDYAQGVYIIKVAGDYISKQSLKLVKQ